MKKTLDLFITFFKIGAFTFGGGYAMIPLVQKKIVDEKKWINDEDILEIVAIAESTPGSIAVNAATFAGYRIAGLTGATAATFGVVLPSFLTIILISCVLDKFESLKEVQYAFRGIRAGVLALITESLYSMYRQCPGNKVSYIIMAGSFILSAFLNLNTIAVIFLCALCGLVTYLYNTGRSIK